jgi:uncharacterized protein (DUF58 family)
VVPTKRLAWLGLVAVLASVVASFVRSLMPALLAYDAALVVLALVDALLQRGKRLEVERTLAAILSVGRANVVDLTVRNTSRRTVRGTVDDDPIVDATRNGLPARVVIPPRSAVRVRYEVTPTRRGGRDFGTVGVRYGSWLGLVSRQERIPAPAHADVYPDVHAARVLDMLRRQGRQDARLGSLRVRGGDTEFERLRPYQRGDETRHIDWRASARRDDPTVRQYQAESDQNVVFAIDIGRAMRGDSGGLTHVDHALNAALLAADVALRGGDKAGLMTFDDVPRAWLKPTGGRSGGRKLTRAVYALEAGLAATDFRAGTAFLQTQMRARSLVVMFTNLIDARSAKELASAVRSLMPRHLPLCVFMRDTDVEALVDAEVTDARDLYMRAAAAESLLWRDDLIRSLRNSGVLVLDAKPEDLTPTLVKSYLDVKARRLL